MKDHGFYGLDQLQNHSTYHLRCWRLLQIPLPTRCSLRRLDIKNKSTLVHFHGFDIVEQSLVDSTVVANWCAVVSTLAPISRMECVKPWAAFSPRSSLNRAELPYIISTPVEGQLTACTGE